MSEKLISDIKKVLSKNVDSASEKLLRKILKELEAPRKTKEG